MLVMGLGLFAPETKRPVGKIKGPEEDDGGKELITQIRQCYPRSSDGGAEEYWEHEMGGQIP